METVKLFFNDAPTEEIQVQNREVDGKTYFVCPCCKVNENMPSMQSLHNHMYKTHYKEKVRTLQFSCDHCENSFETSSQLKRHVIRQLDKFMSGDCPASVRAPTPPVIDIPIQERRKIPFLLGAALEEMISTGKRSEAAR
jgi:hypothetical protein